MEREKAVKVLSLTQTQEERARALHARSLVVAGHTDCVCADVIDQRYFGRRAVLAERHLPVWQQGGVTVVCDHFGGDGPYFDNFPTRHVLPATRLSLALHGLDVLHEEVAESNGRLVLATRVEHLTAAKAAGQAAIIACLEGCMPVEEDLALLRTFYRLGVRCIGLTWNHRNALGDGIGTQTESGLTSFGVAAVEEMQRLGITVDVSHMNDAGTRHVIEIARAPVVASHSNVYALCPHPRNLKDELIKGLAATGGLIGFHAQERFLTTAPPVTIDHILDAIDYVVRLVGVDHVTIGPDLLENWAADVYRRTSMTKSNYVYPEEFDTLAKTGNLTRGLVQRDYDDEGIAKILGGNWLRVFQQTWIRI